METRLCVVGKENGENEELMQAAEVKAIKYLISSYPGKCGSLTFVEEAYRDVLSPQWHIDRYR